MSSILVIQATLDDAEELARICKLAFDEDSYRETDESGNGNPGIDSPSYQRLRMSIYPYYKILDGDKIIGGVILKRRSLDHMEIDRIWVDPEYKGKGIGSVAIHHVEEIHYASRWTLNTPPWAKRNQRFYEKNGYRSLGLDPSIPQYPLLLLEKKINRVK